MRQDSALIGRKVVSSRSGGGSRNRLVLFDLDGTLIDSTPGIWASVRASARRLGCPEPTPQQLTAMVGPPLQDGFRDVLGLDPEDVPAAVAAYREHYAKDAILDVTVYPGVSDVLHELRADGHTLAVATSKPAVYAARILEGTGLAPVFAGIHGATMDGAVRSKSQVVALALAAHPAGARPVLVGDRALDVLGARAHGLPCIGVAWGPGDVAELHAAEAAVVVTTPAGIPAALCQV